VILVPPFEEAMAHFIHSGTCRVFCSPEGTAGIGPTRQWILDYCTEQGEDKVLMLDDDLVFARRRKDNAALFQTATDADIINAFQEVELLLDTYHHVAIGVREGGNRRLEDHTYNGRTLRALAYRVDKLRELDIRFDRAEFMEDFTVALDLLTRGHKNISINWLVQNQNGSNLAGGCSTYRTMERQAESALALKKRFPDFVNVVTKKTKTAWGGQERIDVIIQWKKAYDSGQP
jgi:hypothetical protein